jgi:hypothetical protein
MGRTGTGTDTIPLHGMHHGVYIVFLFCTTTQLCESLQAAPRARWRRMQSCFISSVLCAMWLSCRDVVWCWTPSRPALLQRQSSQFSSIPGEPVIVRPNSTVTSNTPASRKSTRIICQRRLSFTLSRRDRLSRSMLHDAPAVRNPPSDLSLVANTREREQERRRKKIYAVK